MKVFTRDYRMNANFPDSFGKYLGGLNYCVLDIETTGLSRENSKVILIGLLTETDNGIKATQFLAENHYEEHKVLSAALDFLRKEDIKILVTFNGTTFDIPFLKSRLRANFMDADFSLFNLDMYRFVKCSTDLKNRIGSLRQVAIENYYGILDEREDTISGRESISMFDEYSLTGNSTLEKIILTHNREDIVHLFRLMHYVLADVGRDGDIDSAMASCGFPAIGASLCLRPSIKKLGRGKSAEHELQIFGDQISNPFSAAYFPDQDSPIYASFKESSRLFEIKVPVSCAPDEDHSLFIDAAALGISEELKDDPDFINGYLILNPRSINLASEIICNKIISDYNNVK